ncbi:helix-turn-helix transcriptional regulator [Streptomyces sp. NPDC059477]|uniref:helix-turn-helix domain-containing protein n=1 Tax=Streptomyces sp. NPDC059477 TaxID=3346847 RepID=UPI0036BDC04A
MTERVELPLEVAESAALFVAVGTVLKLLRERKGLTQKQFGDLVSYGPDAIGAMERGVRVPRPELLELADKLLDANGLLKKMIPDVHQAIKKARLRHPEWYRSYATLEAQSVELHHYSNQVVQGLLQTEGYARAVFTHWRPLYDEGTIEKRIADRLSRQQLFEGWPVPIVSYVLEEVILDRPIGGREVFAGQLRHLLHMGSMRNVEIQVLPTCIEAHPNLSSAFNLLTPKEHGQVAYTEAQAFPQLITDRNEVRKIADRYGIMRAMALNPLESEALIKKKLEEL